MRGQEDGPASLFLLQDQVFDPPGIDRVQAGGWLIQEQQLWIVQQSPGDAQAVFHAFGKLRYQHITVRLQAHQPEKIRWGPDRALV